MEDLVDTLTRGNPLEVKTVLASVAFALAAYQVVLAAVGFRWVRPKVPEAEPAFRAHRASGDVILVLLALPGSACCEFVALASWRSRSSWSPPSSGRTRARATMAAATAARASQSSATTANRPGT